MFRICLLLLVAAATAMPAWAQQTCAPANRFELNWNNYPDQVLNVNQAHPFVLTNAAGEQLTVTISFAGDIADIAPLNGSATPNISLYNTGGVPGQRSLTIGSDFDARHNNINGNNDVMVINFTFSRPIKDAVLRVVDVDYIQDDFRDWVRLIGFRNGATRLPAISTPSANNVVFTNNNNGFPPIAANDGVGNGPSSPTQDRGNLNGTWSVPVDALQVRYANGPAQYTGGPISDQGIGLGVTAFCSMPNVEIEKSVQPASATGTEKFALPGNDMIYTLKVSNTGSIATDNSPVTLTDLLPASVTMFTGNHAGSGGAFEFVDSGTGLTCCNTVSDFGSGSPVTFGYGPNGSYDPNVTGVRIAPSGNIPAYSSFEVNFRVRIK
ncbi:MAG: hypothetical protein WA979_04135 [Pacificimonas sp.]